jgi:hypothetical protein
VASANTDEVTKSIGDGASKNDQATQEMQKALANFKPSFITVEVLGFGDGTSSSGGCRRDSFKSDDEFSRCVQAQGTRG